MPFLTNESIWGSFYKCFFDGQNQQNRLSQLQVKFQYDSYQFLCGNTVYIQ